ncbi:unnamed protein product [Ambrosiozyma monospora]|uniref:Unnamed protein product n=1 Tax=Ambrosiozyma monospora TaxID=43982 RepID=A0A9W7DIV0_AMBMO|nr:unnamed protein product [Ambrosiozyma monospora]
MPAKIDYILEIQDQHQKQQTKTIHPTELHSLFMMNFAAWLFVLAASPYLTNALVIPLEARQPCLTCGDGWGQGGGWDTTPCDETTTTPPSVITTCTPAGGSDLVPYAKCSGSFTAKAENGNYPKASISFSDFSYVSENVVEVTLQFSASDCLSIDYLGELKIIGLSSPDYSEFTLYSRNSDVSLISEPCSWSQTLTLTTTNSCMGQFQIQFDWFSGPGCESSSSWSYSGSYDYLIDCVDNYHSYNNTLYQLQTIYIHSMHRHIIYNYSANPIHYHYLKFKYSSMSIYYHFV